MKKILICLACLVLVACTKERDYTVSSPDGAMTLSFALREGQPTYSVAYEGRDVLLPSPMGFVLLAGGDTLRDLRWTVESASYDSADTTWETVWGEERFIRDRHHEMKVALASEKLRMHIVFRLFDDGFAFRYEFPAQDGHGLALTVLDELTAYRFAAEPQVWSIPWRTEYYEGIYTKAPLHEKDTICSPITLEMADGMYAFLHEANVTDYPCQNLVAVSDQHSQPRARYQLSTYLTPWMRDGKVLDDKAYVSAPFVTPWRFMILTRTLPEMMASRIMLNLNEPCKIDDTSWIKPMKFLGIWWSMHMKEWTWSKSDRHGATTENMRRYLQFAAENGFGGVLAEGWNTGWEGYEGINNDRFSFVTPYADYDVDALSAYAKELGVAIICHHETSGRADEYEADLDTAYQFMQEHGMPAVKTGYVSPLIRTCDGYQFNRSQGVVRHYRKVIETAAKYHISIDNHEPAMPSGLQRTYPNLMTQEGIRGQEWNAWAQDGGSPCSHVCTLPFTRMMAGPADYTPGVFAFENPIIPGTRVHSTLCNQLALFVVLYSPLQMACDKIENYEKHPAEFQFIRDVPCDWKASRLIDGKIGEYVVMARQDRHSDDWYIGAVTNEEAREITIPLAFLGEGEWTATIYADAPDADWQSKPYATTIERRKVSAKDTINMRLATGGGCAIRFEKN